MSRQFAEIVSKLFSPVTVIPVGFMVFSFLFVQPSSDLLVWSLFTILFCLTPFLLLRYFLESRGWNMEKREDRRRVYALGPFVLLLHIGIQQYLGAPTIVEKLSLSTFAAATVFAVFNERIKISLHVGSISGLSSLFLTESVPAGAALYVLTSLVSWSRIRLEKHTKTEVLLGLLVGTLVGAVYTI